jgi:hypothetical protein
MDDLEITKMCAEAMGYKVASLDPNYCGEIVRTDVAHHPGTILIERRNFYPSPYLPLHDDAQAMALVKRLELRIQEPEPMPTNDRRWCVRKIGSNAEASRNTDLNRAICLCCALMQLESKK